MPETRVLILSLLGVLLIISCIFLAFFIMGRTAENDYPHSNLPKPLDAERYEPLNEREHQIDFGAFQIITDRDVKGFTFKGIDSYVGMICNKIDSFYFDYGWYSGDLRTEYYPDHQLCQDTVNGKVVYVLSPINEEVEDNQVGIYVEQAYKDNRFTLAGRDIVDVQGGLNMFSTLMFHDSRKKSKPLVHGKNCSQGETPTMIFYKRCSSCHSKYNMKLVGPIICHLTFEESVAFFSMKDARFKADSSFSFRQGPAYHRKTLTGVGKDSIRRIASFISSLNNTCE
ncbi:MAG: hypothetical protein AAFY71_02260 [Bacteroidota bacterium]